MIVRRMKNQFFHQMAAENEFFHQFFPGLSVSGSFGAQPVRFTFPVSFQRFQYTCHSVIRTSHNTRLPGSVSLSIHNCYKVIQSTLVDPNPNRSVSNIWKEDNSSNTRMSYRRKWVLYVSESIGDLPPFPECKCQSKENSIQTVFTIWNVHNYIVGSILYQKYFTKGLNLYNIIFHLVNDKMPIQFVKISSFWETLSFLRFQQNEENPFSYFQ